MKKAFSALLLLLMFCQAARAVKISGTVKSSDGRPVAGAEIAVCQSCASGKEKRTTADSYGRFAANVSPCVDPSGKPGSTYVYAYSSGFVPGFTEAKGGRASLLLEGAGQIWGSVVDEKGKPVAGARVGTIFVELPDGKRLNLGCSPFRDKLTAKTTADGRWTITGLPLEGTAFIELSDPRFAEGGITVNLGGDAVPAPPIVARPTAVLTGRVLLENGRPAAGVFVHCNGHSGGGSGALTDKNGVYRITMLRTGLYDVMASDPKGKYLAPAVPGARAKEGETTKLPDMKLETGGYVTGRVLDFDTGRPVEGVYVGAFGTHNPNTTGVLNGVTTDASGSYKLHATPGPLVISVYAEKKGYLRDDRYDRSKLKVAVKKGETVKYDIRIKKGLAVWGTAVDENGLPASGVPLMIKVKLDDYGRSSVASAKTGLAGKFSIAPLQAGKGEFAIDEMSGFDSIFTSQWEAVNPREITVPATAPVKVTVRRIKRIPASGRAVTPAGTPIAGVAVRMWLYTRMDPKSGVGGPCAQRTVTTNSEGRFTFPDLRPDLDVKFDAAEKQGYNYVSGGEVKKSDSAFSFTDIVMAALDALVKGQVVDSGGRPVAGAKVTSPIRGFDEPVLTDSSGCFTLTGVPEGDITLMAAWGTSFGRVTVKSGDGAVVIKLK